MYPVTPGLLHVDGPAPDAVEEELPIGIVVDDVADAADYILASPRGLPTPYYIIRSAGDVPARLGGLALLGRVQVGNELMAALLDALLPALPAAEDLGAGHQD